ncbi:nucleotidyltransferase family protein [Sphaerimonospora thailandensis]|uniref:4-diphosphocytidyl-2C-methyl-D-erythritol synthase n=1 Tax=Sphaerimonospora thailandensis TaxID=795644 RepID=A0A8J3R8Y2_9ACTN|nr:nucleotidyltransferase family protein [Sphaerimonospora thailandensis]GIH68203.1 4-diphosphocytidyl-2C-methyl-D-erythritol synthase [Sphaerimonospora thailandensis]
MGEIAGVLLAAGGGSRLGTPKALVEFAGERLAERGVRLLSEGGCHPVVVVLGAAEIRISGTVAVCNPDWASGMGSSLRVGLGSLPAAAVAAVIALVDQPLVRPAAVARLIEAFHAGATVAVATYGGAPRNPVLIARGHFTDVCALAEGDVGARPFLRAHPELVTPVPCDDVGDPADVDTPEDLAAVRRQAVRPREAG